VWGKQLSRKAAPGQNWLLHAIAATADLWLRGRLLLRIDTVNNFLRTKVHVWLCKTHLPNALHYTDLQVHVTRVQRQLTRFCNEKHGFSVFMVD
jgi:hypothetical protein